MLKRASFILIGVAFAVLLSANLYVSHISGDEQESVEQLRDEFALPGMKILLFGFCLIPFLKQILKNQWSDLQLYLFYSLHKSSWRALK